MQVPRPHGLVNTVWRVAAVLVLTLAMSARLDAAKAAPAVPRSASPERHLVPDWMSDGTARQLDLGFDVLVPTSVPAPFAGEPSVTALDGSYSLYWMVPGTPPTFLQISGELGGVVPDFSKADRNNQLEQNAEVGDASAWHDQTDIYDLVYWQVGDVLYSVESQNLSDTDSLTLANQLVLLTPPVDEPSATTENADVTPTVQPGPDSVAIDMPTEVDSGAIVAISVTGPADAVLDAGGGEFPDYEGLLYYNAPAAPITWRAPEVTEDTQIDFLLRDNYSWDILTTVSVIVKAKVVSTLPAAVNCPETVAPGANVYLTVTGAGYLAIAADKGTFPANVLNLSFSRDAAGGEYIGAEMPASGIATVSYQAPNAKKKAAVKISVVNAQEKEVATCKIAVQPGFTPEPAPSGDSSEFGAGDGSNIVSSGVIMVAQPTTQPTAAATGEATAAAASPEASAEAGSPVVSTAVPTTTPEPTAIPTATLAPAQSADGMVGSTIGPEGGSVTSPGGVTVVIPAGALAEVGTLTIKPKGGSSLPSSDTVLLVAGSAVEIAIAAADGKGIETLADSKRAILQMTFDEATWVDGMQLYLVNGTVLSILPNQTSDSATRTLSAEIPEFSLFAAGRPVSSATGGTSNQESDSGGGLSVPVLAGGALIGVILLTTVFSVLMRRGGGRQVRPKR